MRLASYLRYLHLAYFSKPASQRVLYRAIARSSATRILEIGIGDIARSVRMIQLAQRRSPDSTVRYAAIDLFEARPAADRELLSLKQAHRELKPTQAKIQLIPGDPAQALTSVANSLPNVDLLLISAAHSEATLAEAWFYVPRMLHASSAVYREVLDDDSATELRALRVEEIEKLAGAPRRRAA